MHFWIQQPKTHRNSRTAYLTNFLFYSKQEGFYWGKISCKLKNIQSAHSGLWKISFILPFWINFLKFSLLNWLVFIKTIWNYIFPLNVITTLIFQVDEGITRSNRAEVEWDYTPVNSHIFQVFQSCVPNFQLG